MDDFLQYAWDVLAMTPPQQGRQSVSVNPAPSGPLEQACPEIFSMSPENSKKVTKRRHDRNLPDGIVWPELARLLLSAIAMLHRTQHHRHPIQIGTRVRSYELPGISDRDFITGTVVDRCVIAGLPRFIIRSESVTVRGQEEPCSRTYYEPEESVVNELDFIHPLLELHHVA